MHSQAAIDFLCCENSKKNAIVIRNLLQVNQILFTGVINLNPALQPSMTPNAVVAHIRQFFLVRLAGSSWAEATHQTLPCLFPWSNVTEVATRQFWLLRIFCIFGASTKQRVCKSQIMRENFFSSCPVHHQVEGGFRIFTIPSRSLLLFFPRKKY